MTRTPPSHPPIRFRSARHGDGAALWSLVRRTGTLELNSAYFYLLFAADFGDTCLLAERGGEVVGAVIGYRPPGNPEAAFVWQIGVAPELRGRGLGMSLLEAWLALPANQGARWLTATVATDNEPSRRLFRGFARKVAAPCFETDHFTAELFPHEHPPERLVRIGPLEPGAAAGRDVRAAQIDSPATIDPATDAPRRTEPTPSNQPAREKQHEHL